MTEASSPVPVDLTRSLFFLFGRGTIRVFGSLFGFIPVFRDFVIERLVGLFFPPRAGKFIVPMLIGNAAIVIEPKVGGIVENALYRHGVYETGVVKLIQRLTKEGDVVVDAGANVGAITAFAASHVRASGRVYAFEPVASTAALLKETIAFNKFPNVVLSEFALSNIVGSAPIYASTGTNRGGVSLCSEDHASAVQTVRLDRLDNVLSIEEWKRVKVMKIDVEGWELEALQGAQKLFDSGHSPALIIEYFRGRGERAFQLYNFLKTIPNTTIYKFRYRKRCDGPLVEAYKESDLRSEDNIVVLPHSMKSLVSISR